MDRANSRSYMVYRRNCNDFYNKGTPRYKYFDGVMLHSTELEKDNNETKKNSGIEENK